MSSEPRAANVKATPETAPVGDDEALLRRLLAGDETAGRALWDRHSPMVRRIAMRTFGPAHDVEDVVQDAFLQFFRSAPSIRDPSRLKGFLMALTSNVMKLEIRRRKLRRLLRLESDSDVFEHIPSHDGSDEDRLALIRFYRVLDTLNASERTIFSLRHLEGLGLRELADALHTSLSTVKRRLFTANERVRARINQDPELRAYLIARGLAPDAWAGDEQ